MFSSIISIVIVLVAIWILKKKGILDKFSKNQEEPVQVILPADFKETFEAELPKGTVIKCDFDIHGIKVEEKMNSKLDLLVAKYYIPYSDLFQIKASMGKLNFNFLYNGELFGTTIPTNATDKDRIKKIVEVAKARKGAQSPYPLQVFERNEEYRIKCKTCGNIYCFSYADIKNNAKNLAEEASHRKMAVMNSLGGTQLGAQKDSQKADYFKDKVIDYNRCPSCNSTNLEEMVDEE